MPLLDNPYASVPKEQITRSCVNIPTTDLDFLRRIYPRDGMVQGTLATLIQKLIHELKRNNITDFNLDRYAECVAGCTLVLPGCAADQSRSVSNGDDGRTNSSVACTAPSASSIVPDAGKSPRRTEGRGIVKKQKVG